MELPPVPRTARENVIDDVHGSKITDPYRWLEADATDRVREWTDQQNSRTRAVLDALPQRAAFVHRLRDERGLTVLLSVAYGVREMRNAKKIEQSEDAE